MRYFLRAAGNTFQVGSSRLTLNLKASELSCRGFVGGTSAELEASATPWVAFDFSAVFVERGNGDEPPFRE